MTAIPWHELTPLGARMLRVGRGIAPDGREHYLQIPLDTLLTHAQIVATTGAGKSHLGKVILAEALRVGAGCGVLDFKGDLVQDMLRLIPQERWADVVIVDPLDHQWPVGLNLLDPLMLHGGQQADLLVSQLESTIVSLDENWKTSVGMQQFLGWGAKALVDGEPVPTLDHLYTFFASSAYREQVLAQMTDTTTRLWWEQTFPSLSEQQTSSIAPLLRRLDQFRMNALVRRMCNQSRTTVPFRQLMDARGILLAALPVELIGEKEGVFLAALVVNLIVAAAFTRQSLPERERDVWLLFIDEFQEAIGRGDPATYTKILERLRSFGVGLILAHQHMGQLQKDVLDATLNIVRTRFILSALGDDAAIWARQYAGSGLTRDDFAAIPIREEGYMTTQHHGLPLPLCTFTPLPLWPAPPISVSPVYEPQDWQAWHPPAQSEQESFLDSRIKRLLHAPADEALEALIRCPEPLWSAYIARTAAWRAHQRSALLCQPGLIRDDAERLRWLSRLRVARPWIEVQAALVRRAMQFPRDLGAPARASAAHRPAASLQPAVEPQQEADLPPFVPSPSRGGSDPNLASTAAGPILPHDIDTLLADSGRF